MVLSGCASPAPEPAALPEYVAPDIDPSKGALVKGSSGTYIVTVDNAAVKTGPIQFDWGGNQALLAPGRHLITVERHTSAAFFGHTYRAAYEHRFEAGHVYQVGEAAYSDRATKMIDMNTGAEIRAK